MRKTEMKLRDAVIETARAQIGYRAVPGVGTSMFGSWAGHPQGRWDGAFLDWCAAEVGVELHRMTDANWALREYIRTGKLYRKPRIGDIAFLHPNRPFEMPQPGIVTAIVDDTHVRLIAGESSNPQPRANKDPIGVYEIELQTWQIIGFGRPRYQKSAPIRIEEQTVQIRTSDIQWHRQNQKVQTVQFALADTVGAAGMRRGRFDTMTQDWYREWQRKCGQVNPDGIPDDDSLQKLGAATGLFTWREL